MSFYLSQFYHFDTINVQYMKCTDIIFRNDKSVAVAFDAWKTKIAWRYCGMKTGIFNNLSTFSCFVIHHQNQNSVLLVSVLLRSTKFHHSRFTTVSKVIMDITPSPRRSFEIVSPLTNTDFEENFAVMETFNQIFEVMKVSNRRLISTTLHPFINY